jgi:hypothetical protein
MPQLYFLLRDLSGGLSVILLLSLGDVSALSQAFTARRRLKCNTCWEGQAGH